jgi:hypothetical protein
MLDALQQPGTNKRGKVRRPLSETSLQHTYDLLHVVLDYAVRQRVVAHNVLADVDRPRRQAAEMHVWSARQLAAFLARVTTTACSRCCGWRATPALAGASCSPSAGRPLICGSVPVSIASRRTRVGYEMVHRPGTKTAAGALGWGSAYVDSRYVSPRRTASRCTRTTWRTATSASSSAGAAALLGAGGGFNHFPSRPPRSDLGDRGDSSPRPFRATTWDVPPTPARAVPRIATVRWRLGRQATVASQRGLSPTTSRGVSRRCSSTTATPIRWCIRPSAWCPSPAHAASAKVPADQRRSPLVRHSAATHADDSSE